MVDALVFLGIVAFLATVLGSVWRDHLRRRAGLRALARRLGVGYFPKGVGGPAADAPPLRRWFGRAGVGRPAATVGDMADVFGPGEGERPRDTLHGRVDVAGTPRELWAGEIDGRLHGRVALSFPVDYVMLALPGPVPRVWVRPRRPADAAMPAGLRFESVAFNDAYHVRADDERLAYDLLHPGMIELFLSLRPAACRFGDGFLVLHNRRGGSPWAAVDFERGVRHARAILSRWPRHLLAEETT